MAIPRSRRPGPAVPALALGTLPFLLAACSPAGEADPLDLSRSDDNEGPVFLTLSTAPDTWMQALYRGPVVLDGGGCLRLDTSDRHTVVWPRGYRLADHDGQLAVLDDEGREIGRVGGSFRLSGGEVASLHDGLPLSDDVRQRAEDRCPGRYWLAGSPSD